MFIELTKPNEKGNCSINVNHIVDFGLSEVDRTVIYLTADGSCRIIVEESYAQVKEKIAHATGKEVF